MSTGLFDDILAEPPVQKTGLFDDIIAEPLTFDLTGAQVPVPVGESPEQAGGRMFHGMPEQFQQGGPSVNRPTFRLPRIPQAQQDVTGGALPFATDVVNSGIGLVEGLIQPEMIAPLLLAGLTPPYGPALGASYFAGKAIEPIPGQVMDIQERRQENPEAGLLDPQIADSVGAILQELGFAGLMGPGMRIPRRVEGPGLRPSKYQGNELNAPRYDWRKDPNVVDVTDAQLYKEIPEVAGVTDATIAQNVNPPPVNPVIKSERPVTPPDYRLGREQPPVILPEQMGQPIRGQRLLPYNAGPQVYGPPEPDFRPAQNARFVGNNQGQVEALTDKYAQGSEQREFFRGPRETQTREGVGVRPSQGETPVIGGEAKPTSIILYDASGKPVRLQVEGENTQRPLEQASVASKAPVEPQDRLLPSKGEFYAHEQPSQTIEGLPSKGVARATDAFRENVEPQTSGFFAAPTPQAPSPVREGESTIVKQEQAKSEVKREPMVVAGNEPTRTPIRIKNKETGVEQEGEFTGYMDASALGKGWLPTIGRRVPATGRMSHGLLDTTKEEIVGKVPTVEEWQKGEQEKRLAPGKGMQIKVGEKGKESGSIINPFKSLVDKFSKREKELRGDFATDAPRALLDPKISGFQNPSKEVDAVQLVNRLKNKVSPAEMDIYEKSGTLEQIRKMGKVSPEKAAEMLQEAGPRTEVHSYGMEGKVSEAKREYDRMTHEWYDGLDAKKQQAINYATGDAISTGPVPYAKWPQHIRAELAAMDKEKVARYVELVKQIENEPRDTSPRATSAYDTVSALPTNEPMPEWTKSKEGKNVQRVDVVIPHNEKLAAEARDRRSRASVTRQNMEREAGVLWSPDNLHENLPNTLGWAMIQYKDGPKRERIAVIVEAQSRWGQTVREHEAAYKRAVDSGRIADTEMTRAGYTGSLEGYGSDTKPHPLLRDYNRLILKAAIDQARKEGASHIVVSDAETAMMTEGHDAHPLTVVKPTEKNLARAKEIVSYGEESNVGYRDAQKLLSGKQLEYEAGGQQAKQLGYDTVQEAPQEPGMRLNYDSILPKIAEELTGGKGERVTLGEHKNAFVKHSRPEPIEADEFGRTTRKNLIFKNPDGSPKTSVTGMMYPLEKVPTQAASLFEKDRPETRGAKIYGGIPWFDPDFWKASSPNLVEGKIQPFKDYASEFKDATTPFGVGKIPQKRVKGKVLGKEFDFKLGLGQLLDPRSYRDTAAEKALLTHQYQVYKGKQMTALLLEGAKRKGNPFKVNDDGSVILMNGKKDFFGDVIEAELVNPGSQSLTKPQKEFIQWWKARRAEGLDMLQKEGIEGYVDADGNIVPMDEGYFPRPAIGSDKVEAGKNPPARTRVGTEQFFQKHRPFPTEAQGVAEGIKYEPNPYARVGRWLEAVYRTIADKRLADDPSMKGVGEKSAFHTGAVFHPALAGRVFPKDVQAKINAYYQNAPGKYARGFQNVNDFMKSMQFTFDVSAPLNQGLAMMGSNPMRWAKATAKSYQALLDENTLSKYLGQKENMEAAQAITNNGGSIAYLYDFLQGSQTGKLAGAIPPIRASARSMGTFLSIAKIELYKAFKPLAREKGWSDTELVEAVENTLFSGRMEGIGVSPQRALTERLIFNAPSYMRGAAGLIAMAGQGGASGTVARRALLGLMSATLVVAVGSYLSQVEDGTMTKQEMHKRLDPRNSEFMRFRVPVGAEKGQEASHLETSYGNIVLSGVRTLGDTINIATSDKQIGPGKKNPAIKFGANRLAPWLQFSQQVLSGKNYRGDDVGPVESGLRAMVPLNVAAATEKGSGTQKATAFGLSTLGLSSFPEGFGAKRMRLLGEEGKRLFGKENYSDLSFGQRKAVDKIVAKKMGQEKAEQDTTRSAIYSIEQTAKLGERLTKEVNPEIKKELKTIGHGLGGYRTSKKEDKKSVFLTMDERRALHAHVLEELNGQLGELMKHDLWQGLTPDQKKKQIEKVETRAHERAWKKMKYSMSE